MEITCQMNFISNYIFIANEVKQFIDLLIASFLAMTDFLVLMS